MKNYITYLFSIFFVTALLVVGLWYFYRENLFHSPLVNSPIPDFLMLSKNNQVKLLDLWSPVVQQIQGSSGDLPDLTAQSVLMYDLTENKVLYEKDPEIRHPMASLTKIMTAVIALENPKLDDRYKVASDDVVGEDSMGVSAGEVYTLQNLLYGLVLHSGNDAAEVLAHNYPGGRSTFIQAMNDKAKALGMLNTVYSNPSGLQGDGKQYTTTYDLLILTRYALEHYPIFVRVVSTVNYTIPATNDHAEINLSNETNLLTSYPGVKGVKDGYTPQAGLCLVTFLDYGDHKIIGIILNSQNRRGEMKELLDYSLKTVNITPPPFEEN
ncbi:MAG TPA: D-alanyl-D-alanine carboxypeptidase family protein [Candidatus Sulfotelmatobacter sp.]|jgi:D-alanyl-D-alanine carboxypeptidase (penicillin-binding protein 5/6)|nr:D-alanyl-D-alanine carboxypeptidase family protein [Candidatus Sulfotelmatobacter sp.]